MVHALYKTKEGIRFSWLFHARISIANALNAAAAAVVVVVDDDDCVSAANFRSSGEHLIEL